VGDSAAVMAIGAIPEASAATQAVTMGAIGNQDIRFMSNVGELAGILVPVLLMRQPRTRHWDPPRPEPAGCLKTFESQGDRMGAGHSGHRLNLGDTRRESRGSAWTGINPFLLEGMR